MDTNEFKNQFDALLRRADRYIRSPRKCKPSAVNSWRSSCVRWLRIHLPDSGLPEEMLTVPPPKDEGYYHPTLDNADVRNVQKALKVLLRARQLLPFLQERAAGIVPMPDNSSKVFIVHGHNDALKLSAARLIDKLGLESVILHEMPNKGRTIIEKFVNYADVAFAIVLLTGDDKGGSTNTPIRSYHLRARQNVILELGYFLGRLGRDRVVAIYDQDVEIPSDYSGVLFIPHDENGAWQMLLAKEMKAVGLKIDMNNI